jgi:hypothetical protein
MSRARSVSLALGVALAGIIASPAAATVLYELGTKTPTIIDSAKCGAIYRTTDPVEGSVLVARADDCSGDRERAEWAVGAATLGSNALQPGRTYYLGWRGKFVMAGGATGGAPNNPNTVMQSKSHGPWMSDSPSLNYPITMGVDHGTFHVTKYGNGMSTVWSIPYSQVHNKWFSFVMKITYSRTNTGGVGVWFNGVPQTLSNGQTWMSCPTWSGDSQSIHWGIYRLRINGTSYYYMKDNTIATTFEEANPDGGSPPPRATPTPTPTPRPGARVTPTPTATPAPGGGEITPNAVTASTHDGNVPGNAVDNNLSTRWSANGDGQWLKLDLGSVRTVSSVRIATYQGNMRSTRFDIQVSSDNTTWTNALTGASTSGTTNNEEAFDFADRSARYVRYMGHGNTTNSWNSVTEISVFGP